MTKKVWLKDVNFDFEKSEDNPLGPHLSYTTPSVGGAASGLNDPLLLKAENAKLTQDTVNLLKQSDEVRVTMSMEEFLKKFFNMFFDDAAMLTKLLGFESSLDRPEEREPVDFQEELRNKVDNIEILKSLKEGKSKLSELSPEDQLDVLKLHERFENQFEWISVQSAVEKILLDSFAVEDVLQEVRPEEREQVLEMLGTSGSHHEEDVEKNLHRATVSMGLADFIGYFQDLDDSEQSDSLMSFKKRAEDIIKEPFFEQRLNDFDFIKSVDKKDVESLTDAERFVTKLFQYEFSKGLLSGSSPEGNLEGRKDDENRNVTKKTQKGEKSNMSEKDTKDKVNLEDIQKSLQEQIDQQEQIIKQYQEREDKRIEQELISKAKGFAFVGEDKAEAVGKLFKSLEEDQLEVLLDVFKSAQEKVKEKEDENDDMFVQKSVSGESDSVQPDEKRLNAVNKALGIVKESE